jgi:hypothetical protein
MSDEVKGGLPAAVGGGVGNTPALDSTRGFHINLAGVPIPLSRTFGALDKLLALPIEYAAEAVERKFKGNLGAHVDAVQERRQRRGRKEKLENPSPGALRAMNEWAASAGEVPKSDLERSALWRALLDGIMDDDEDGQELLEIVKRLPRSDVREFLWTYGRESNSTLGLILSQGEDLARLQASGLLERKFKLLPVVWFGIAGTLGTVYLLAQIVFQEFGTAILAIMIMSGLGGAGALRVRRPSRLGKKLCELYEEYRIAGSKESASEDRSRSP